MPARRIGSFLKKLRIGALRYWIWILIAVAGLAILAGLVYLLGVRPPNEFTIATGRQGSAHYEYAQIYQQRFAELGYTLNIRETAGSVETVQLLEKGEVDAGFVQNTVAGSTPDSGLTTLAALFYEPLWVFYREAGVETPNSLADLVGVRINIGEAGSGGYLAALGLLAMNGVNEENAVLSTLPIDDATAQLAAGELDALMLFAGARSPEVPELMSIPGVRLLSIRRAAAYASRYKNLSAVVLPEGVIDLTNDLPPEDTSLVAAQATLVAGPSLHPDLARLLLIVAAEIHRQGGILEAPNEFPSPLPVGIPMNADAERYLESGPTWLEQILPLWLASRLERLALYALPAFLILYPILRAIPSASGMLFRQRNTWQYRRLFDIERGYLHYDSAQLAKAITELESWQAELTNNVGMPTLYLDDVYNFRMHIEYALNRLYARKKILEQSI